MYKKVAHKGVDMPMQFLRDDKGRWTGIDLKAGWYQDIDGNLYKYDGVVWDEVPKDRLEKLEYLG
jgi:hypothetical protein